MIDIPQQNNKGFLCGERDEIIDHIIRECSKLAQKEYKTRQDWLQRVIHWELCGNKHVTILQNACMCFSNMRLVKNLYSGRKRG